MYNSTNLKLKRKFALICSLILLSLVQSNQSLAYQSSVYGTHHMIFDQAIETLRENGYDSVADLMEYYMPLMKIESDEIDDPLLEAKNHYMNWDTHAGIYYLIESSGEFAERSWINAKALYFDPTLSSHFDISFKYMARIMHLIQDATVPHHSTGNGFAGHREYESIASSQDDKFIGGYKGSPNFRAYYEDLKTDYDSNINTCGWKIFQLNHCNPDTIFGWIDYSAHLAGPRIAEVDCKETWTETLDLNDYSCLPGTVDDQERLDAMQDLQKYAVTLSAGLMKYLFDKLTVPHISGTTGVVRGFAGNWDFDITFPYIAPMPIMFKIDWGDGNQDTIITDSNTPKSASHTYQNSGSYQIIAQSSFDWGVSWSGPSGVYQVNVGDHLLSTPQKPSGPTYIGSVGQTRNWNFYVDHPQGSSHSDPNIPVLFEIRWGWNVWTQGWTVQQVSGNAGITKSVSHRFNDPGYFWISVRGSLDGGLRWTSWSSSLRIYIYAAPPPGGGGGGGPY
ncbi:MAG: hypothetical protein IH840_00250 [Candidatus Heimdallarchaeota archaeon]|nr:hypothetical protein [Candidatus Heimdallarchaeota archaeon]